MTRFLRATLINILLSALKSLHRSRLRSFVRSLKNPIKAQTTCLENIVKLSTQSAYGRELGITRDFDYHAFRENVPIVTYDKLEPWIREQLKSREPVICPDSPVIFERTSGSSGQAKLIPYGRALLKAFDRMFVMWSLNLFDSGLRLRSGRLFFLVSPGQKGEFSPLGVPIGFRDDRQYLGRFNRFLANFFFVDHSRILANSKNYIEDLALCLLKERDLEIISIWSPSLFVMVMQHIETHRSALSRDLNLSIETRDILSEVKVPMTGKWSELWPALRLISCWDSANSATDANRIKDAFPGVWVQGKGLLATEAPMTVPWVPSGEPLPLLEDIFFEFEDETDGEIRLLNEIAVGKTYRLIISTPGGFLRYRLGDRVEACVGLHATPSLRFLGRTAETSDLVGEKVNSIIVTNLLEQIESLKGSFSLLLPWKTSTPPFYVLVTSQNLSDNEQRSVELQIETGLATQHHYALARQMGQLGHAQIVCLSSIRSIYYEKLATKGMQLGQVKNRALISDASLGIAMSAHVSPGLRSSNAAEPWSSTLDELD